MLFWIIFRCAGQGYRRGRCPGHGEGRCPPSWPCFGSRKSDVSDLRSARGAEQIVLLEGLCATLAAAPRPAHLRSPIIGSSVRPRDCTSGVFPPLGLSVIPRPSATDAIDLKRSALWGSVWRLLREMRRNPNPEAGDQNVARIRKPTPDRDHAGRPIDFGTLGVRNARLVVCSSGRELK
jgi:hypothetical protein